MEFSPHQSITIGFRRQNYLSSRCQNQYSPLAIGQKAVGQEKGMHVQANSPSIFRYLHGMFSDHPDLFRFGFRGLEIGRSDIRIIYRGIINKQKLGAVVLLFKCLHSTASACF